MAVRQSRKKCEKILAMMLEQLEFDPSGSRETGWFKFKNRRMKKEWAGSLCRDGYRRISAGGYTRNEHILVWFLHNRSVPDYLDHIDNDRLNNGLANLRSVTAAQNAWNITKPTNKKTSSQFRGVTKIKTGQWVTIIKYHNRQIRPYTGWSEENAAIFYNFYAAKLFGEFAKLNLVPQKESDR